MANDIDKTSPHYKGEFGSIYEVNQKFPNGGVAGDYVEIDGWAHYWNADRGTWCVNAQRDSYWDELITGIIEKFKLFKGATYMGVAGVSTVPEKIAGVKMYYFAKAAGTYSGFGGLQLAQGINVLYTDNGTSWTATPLLEVAQELGVSTEKVMSQKAVNTELGKKADKAAMDTALDKKADKADMDVELGKKANTADVNTKFTEEKKRLDAELGKKFDKESVAQEAGDSEELVMSQKAVSAKLSDLATAVTKKLDIYPNYDNIIITKETIEDGYVLDKLNNNNSWIHDTRYLSINEGDIVNVYSEGIYKIGISCYDENFNYIGPQNWKTSYKDIKITVSNTKYIIVNLTNEQELSKETFAGSVIVSKKSEENIEGINIIKDVIQGYWSPDKAINFVNNEEWVCYKKYH